MRRRTLLATPLLAAVPAASILATVPAASLLAAVPAAGQAPLRFYTAGAGSAFLPYGEGLAAFVGRQGIAIAVERSAGSLENLAKVEDDPRAIGTAFLGSAADALAGAPAAGGRVHGRVRALFPMYETSFQAAALRGSGLTKLADLAGKRVGAGPARGPAEVFLRAALAAAGIEAEVVPGDPAALATALARGEIDAFWQGAIVPIPSLLAAQAQADAIVFGLDPALVAAVVARLPYLAPTTIAPGTYRGQDAPLHSFAAWNFVVGNAALPEAEAHALTRAALSSANPAAEIHPAAAGTRAQNAPNNPIVPFHPGAARYYAERGITVRAG
jgi:TRAP transporter TAXI family solute receptor